jgi:hypothetical protein
MAPTRALLESQSAQKLAQLIELDIGIGTAKQDLFEQLLILPHRGNLTEAALARHVRVENLTVVSGDVENEWMGLSV